MDFRLSAVRAQERMNVGFFHEWTLPDGAAWTEFYRTEAGYLLRFPELADFAISGANFSVTCHPAPGVTEATSRHLFLNQVLPLVLSKRGKLVFHASAVEVKGVALAFLAGSGKGKSTLAASFATGGYRFLTDDGLVVEDDKNGFQALPSHPSIRLLEDSRESLVPASTASAAPVQYTSKVRLLAGNEIAFCDEPRPLHRAYFLGDGEARAVAFVRLSAAQVLVELVKNSFLLDIEERPMLATHFNRVALLANRLVCYRLDYPRRFEVLALVRETIVGHCMEEEEPA